MNKINFELPIYTYEIDFAGHVSNIVYIQWTEIARTRLLEAAGYPISYIVTSGITPVLTDTTISYKKPLYLQDKVLVEMWVSQLTRVTMIMQFRFYTKEGVLACTGHQRGAFLDQKTQRPIRLSEELRKGLENYLIHEEP